jgi:hypothetical protein
LFFNAVLLTIVRSTTEAAAGVLIIGKLSTPPFLPGGSREKRLGLFGKETPFAFLQLGPAGDPSLETHACHRPA